MAGIIRKQGSIWTSGASVIVVTVNCVGVMGAGIAKQCRERYPDVEIGYQHWCKHNQPRPGDIYMSTRQDRPAMLCVATKDHWRDPSRLEWIRPGCEHIKEYTAQFTSVAVPPLGCGLGGLHWNQVLPIMLDVFGGETSQHFILYAPQGRR